MIDGQRSNCRGRRRGLSAGPVLQLADARFQEAEDARMLPLLLAAPSVRVPAVGGRQRAAGAYGGC
jgi:hypothetical protein